MDWLCKLLSLWELSWGLWDVILNEVDTNDVNIDVDLNLNITDDSNS